MAEQGQIYVVFGQAGEYSDWRFWPVSAWDSREEAEAEARRLNEWVRGRLQEDAAFEDWNPPGDPACLARLDRPSYEVQAVPKGVADSTRRGMAEGWQDLRVEGIGLYLCKHPNARKVGGLWCCLDCPIAWEPGQKANPQLIARAHDPLVVPEEQSDG